MYINRKRLRAFLRHTFGADQFLDSMPLLPWIYTIFHDEDTILREEQKMIADLRKELDEYRAKYVRNRKK